MSATHAETRFKPGTWLRWIGAITFLGAGVLFLLEGVADAGALRRELSWAGITVVLSLLGIVAARVGRDPAGARVLLGLSAATIPAHFAQVGAQIWGYHVDGTGTLLDVTAGGVVLVALGPPLAVGISALVRGRGLLMTLLLFALSCPLLAPTRDGDVVATLAVGEVLVLLLVERTAFRNDPRMKTREGMSARAMLLVPPSILLVRSAFYPTTALWTAALFVVPSIVLLALPGLTHVRAALARVMQSASVVGLALGLAIAGGQVGWLGLGLSVVGLLGTRASLDEPRVFAQVGTVIFVLSSIAAWVWPSADYALLVVPVGALHVVAAHRARSLPFLAASLAATLAGLVGQLAPVVRFPSHDRWLVAAVVGVALLASASIVERYRAWLERRWSTLAAHFAGAPASVDQAAREDAPSPGAHTCSATASSAGPYRGND